MTGTCLADLGNQVTCHLVAEKIERLNQGIMRSMSLVCKDCSPAMYVLVVCILIISHAQGLTLFDYILIVVKTTPNVMLGGEICAMSSRLTSPSRRNSTISAILIKRKRYCSGRVAGESGRGPSTDEESCPFFCSILAVSNPESSSEAPWDMIPSIRTAFALALLIGRPAEQVGHRDLPPRAPIVTVLIWHTAEWSSMPRMSSWERIVHQSTIAPILRAHGTEHQRSGRRHGRRQAHRAQYSSGAGISSTDPVRMQKRDERKTHRLGTQEVKKKT